MRRTGEQLFALGRQPSWRASLPLAAPAHPCAPRDVRILLQTKSCQAQQLWGGFYLQSQAKPPREGELISMRSAGRSGPTPAGVPV